MHSMMRRYSIVDFNAVLTSENEMIWNVGGWCVDRTCDNNIGVAISRCDHSAALSPVHYTKQYNTATATE